MPEKPAPSRPKFWTPKRFVTILSALFIATGAYLHVKNIANPVAGVLLLLGMILAIVLLTRPPSG